MQAMPKTRSTKELQEAPHGRGFFDEHPIIASGEVWRGQKGDEDTSTP